MFLQTWLTYLRRSKFLSRSSCPRLEASPSKLGQDLHTVQTLGNSAEKTTLVNLRMTGLLWLHGHVSSNTLTQNVPFCHISCIPLHFQDMHHLLSILAYTRSVSTYTRSVSTYTRSVSTYTRSVSTYTRSVSTYTRSVSTCSGSFLLSFFGRDGKATCRDVSAACFYHHMLLHPPSRHSGF